MGILDLPIDVLDLIMRQVASYTCLSNSHCSIRGEREACGTLCCMELSVVCQYFYRLPILAGLRQLHQSMYMVQCIFEKTGSSMWYSSVDEQPSVRMCITKRSVSTAFINIERMRTLFSAIKQDGKSYNMDDSSFYVVRYTKFNRYTCARIVFYHPQLCARQIIDQFKYADNVQKEQHALVERHSTIRLHEYGYVTRPLTSPNTLAALILCDVTRMWQFNRPDLQKEYRAHTIIQCANIAHYQDLTLPELSIYVQPINDDDDDNVEKSQHLPKKRRTDATGELE